MKKPASIFDDGRGGFIFSFDEPMRSDEIRRHLELNDSFTDTLSTKDWKINSSELCFISVSNGLAEDEVSPKLHYAAVVRKIRNVATFKSLVRFDFVVSVPDLSIVELIDNAESRFKRYFQSLWTARAERLPPKTWSELISAILKSKPETKSGLEEIDRRRNPPKLNMAQTAKSILAEEKDALGLALKIFGLDYNRALRHWRMAERVDSGSALNGFQDISERMAPAFLRGTTRAVIREDTMIEFDKNNFLNWDVVQGSKVGTVTFESFDERLTIINANRTAIEKNLGVDLIYYNHRFDSYVMVQYKRLVKDDFEGKRGHFYRPAGDRSYGVEFDRMSRFQATRKRVRPAEKINDYRLNDDLFYFKLCDSEQEDLFSSKLIKGMYFPLELWNLVLQSESVKGPRGGVSVGYQSVDRYLNNDSFSDLVKGGWIGSRVSEGEKLGSLLNDLLRGNNSLILASTSKIY